MSISENIREMGRPPKATHPVINFVAGGMRNVFN